MARLTAISGVGGKLPAAFLLEIEGKRLLLDLGEGPEPGVFPDVDGLSPVDAVCLSHAHMDHAGALHLRERLGNPAIYATAATFSHLSPAILDGAPRRVLPEYGSALIEGVEVMLGRCGHAPGGVWFHFAADGGILYTGDWSAESLLLPFDTPPPAMLLVTDASYGDRDTCLADQIDAIAAAAAPGAVLPVPGGGRGPEMALALAARGLHPMVCAKVFAEMRALTHGDAVAPDKQRLLQELVDQHSARPWHPGDVVIAAEANGEAGTSASLVARRAEGFRFIFSSHVPRGTPAETLIAAGEAIWMPWNVHPRLRDVLQLADETGASKVMPAFVAPEAMPHLAEKLGHRLVTTRTVVASQEISPQRLERTHDH